MRPEPRLLFGHDAQVAEWVAARLPDHTGFDDKVTALGIVDSAGYRVLAGVVYHDFAPVAKTMAMTIASESPLFATRGTIKALLHYPFVQQDCFKVWATTPLTNKRAQRFLSKVGFKREGILRHQFGPKKHAVFFGLLKSEFFSIYGQS